MTTGIYDVLATWTTAQRAHDTRTPDALLVHDFMRVGPIAFVLDKPSRVGRFGHGHHYEQLDLDKLTIRRHGNPTVAVARQQAVGDADAPVSCDTRVSSTATDDRDPTIAGMRCSYIGPRLGGPQ